MNLRRSGDINAKNLNTFSKKKKTRTELQQEQFRDSEGMIKRLTEECAMTSMHVDVGGARMSSIRRRRGLSQGLATSPMLVRWVLTDTINGLIN